MSGLHDQISSILYDRYGYVAGGVPDAIMAVIADEAPPESKGVALHTFLLAEAKRELDDTLEAPSAYNLRNALMSVIRAIEALAQ